jgi:Flp pilus assembly protein TadG
MHALRSLKSCSRLMTAFRSDCGMAAVEFAIGATLLTALFVPLIDLGIGFYQKMQVQDAAQAGAQYALAHGWNSTAIQTAVVSATTLSSISASPAPAEICGCPQGTSVSPSSCGGTCASGQTAGTYVTVSAQAAYSPLIPYPVLGRSVMLTAQATARIQ